MEVLGMGFDGIIRNGVRWKYWGWGSMEVLGMGFDGFEIIFVLTFF